MTASKERIDKVPLINKFAFGSGDVGPAVATAILGFYLLYFLTDIVGISPAWAGTILLINKIWDSVNDPIVGMVSDRVRTRWGRRRPWFLFGAVPFGLMYFLMWQVPPFSETGLIVYYLIVSLFLDLGFTVVNVPYTALTPEMTSDYDERTSLTNYRFAFSIGSGLIAAVTHPMIVGAFPGDPRTGYMVSALIWSVLCTIPFFFAFAGTYERHTVEQDEQLPFWQGLRIAFGNRAFRYVTSIYLLSWLVVQTVQAVIIYYLTYWIGDGDLMAPVVLAVQGSAIIWLFIWTALSRRVGKKGVYYLGMVFWIVVELALFIVQPDWPQWVVLVLGALAGVGVATAYLVPWAMLPDVIELDELETGQRREGLFFGFFVLLQKLGLALGLFLVGQVLNWSGYITPPVGYTGVTVQPESALLAIRIMVGPVPAVILLAGIGLVYLFPITKESHQKTLEELARRKQAQEGAQA